MRSARVLAFVLVPVWILILNLYHAGVFPPPKVDLSEKAEARWYPRADAGINNLVLIGAPFARGRAAGEVTGPLLREQEQTLVSRLDELIPAPALTVRAIVLAAIGVFHDADKYFSDEVVQEMYGTSLSAPKEFDYLADGFTRQVAYHGLHEVGQMMVDQGFDDTGCTVAAVKMQNTFVVGRNFDFEAGRVFDREKIIKWVFPDKGYAFVSVTWAGMVGAVTGVNEKGVYISLNAGGSSDHRRIGVPSTLVILDVLEHAANAGEALEIIRSSQMFITDILVVLDAQGSLYRVEKSPLRMNATPVKSSIVIANHLNSPDFAGDETNLFRKQELTTVAREARGLQILASLPAAADPSTAVHQVLTVLRDKGDDHGHSRPLGDRQAIDALIAMHSVIYDPLRQLFFVGTGPSVSGRFLGYDLKQSFHTRTPVRAGELPADPLVSPQIYDAVKTSLARFSRVRKLALDDKCDAARAELAQVTEAYRNQAGYFHSAGDVEACAGNPDLARAHWVKALALHPAYAREVRQLTSRIAK